MRATRAPLFASDLASPARVDPKPPATVAGDIFGTEGDDVITPSQPVGGPNTTAGNDVVHALGGNDRVETGQGADWVDGGAGQDTLLGAGSDDTLLGGDGNDVLGVSPGNPYLFRAVLMGGAGDDTLSALGANAGVNSLLDGGDGNDVITYMSDSLGGDGSTVLGGAGNDLITLMAPDITVDAGSGDDTVVLVYDGDLLPTSGDITLGEGRDTLVLSQSTGAGYDPFYVPRVTDFQAGAGGDVLALKEMLSDTFGALDSNPFLDGRLSFTQVDDEVHLVSGRGIELRLPGLDPTFLTSENIAEGYAPNGDFVVRDLQGGMAADTLRGGDGNDTLRGGGGNDLLDGLLGGTDLLAGGHGNDTLLGFSGNDTLQGQSGSDALFGGSGDDLILGGDGDDQAAFNAVVHGIAVRGSGLVGGYGNDMILGGKGADQLAGHHGNDTLYGGEGDDLLVGDGAGTPWMRGEQDHDVFVFTGAASDGVDTVKDFSTFRNDHDVIDLSRFFGPAGATLLDGTPGSGDDFDPLTGPVATLGQNVLSFDAALGHAPDAGDLAALLAGSSFEAGAKQAFLVHDSAGGNQGSMWLFVGADRAGDQDTAITQQELRLIGELSLGTAPNGTNDFVGLQGFSLETGGPASQLPLAWSAVGPVTAPGSAAGAVLPLDAATHLFW